MLELSTMQARPRVSFDTILLLTLVLPNLWFNQVSNAVVMTLAGLYLAIDLYANSASHLWLRIGSLRDRLYIVKYTILVLTIAVQVMVPALYFIVTRIHGMPDEHLHDGAFQTEIALSFLAHGQNPYSASYIGTGLESYHLTDAPENPALYSYAYLPFVLYLSAPFAWLASSTLGWFDQRLVYLIAFLVVLGLLPQLTQDPQKKLVLVILVGLNFYTAEFLRDGRNDILVFMLILAVILALRRQSVQLAGLFLGIACAVKPSAWFFIPFFSLFVTGSLSWRATASLWLRRMPLFWIALAAGIVPFLMWDAAAFYKSAIAYSFGLQGAIPYPIRGLGLSVLLLMIGAIGSPLEMFPFWIMQIPAGVAVLMVALRSQLRRNSINMALLGSACLFLITMFLSRFFQNNYLYYALLIMVAAVFADPFSFSNQALANAQVKADG